MLELEHNVMDFLLATDTPYINDYQEPKAIIGKQNNILNRGNKKEMLAKSLRANNS